MSESGMRQDVFSLLWTLINRVVMMLWGSRKERKKSWNEPVALVTCWEGGSCWIRVENKCMEWKKIRSIIILFPHLLALSLSLSSFTILIIPCQRSYVWLSCSSSSSSRTSFILLLHSFPLENTLFFLPLLPWESLTQKRRESRNVVRVPGNNLQREDGMREKCSFSSFILLLTLGEWIESELLVCCSFPSYPSSSSSSPSSTHYSILVVSRRCCKEWTKVKCIEDEVQLSSDGRWVLLCVGKRSDDVSSSFMWNSFFSFLFPSSCSLVR